jgi:multiple antibiotic resistance protein
MAMEIESSPGRHHQSRGELLADQCERHQADTDEKNQMVQAAKSLFLILSALFPIVDPLGGSPIFLAMTREYSPSTRRALSWRIAMNSFFLLVGSYFIGTHILSFFGISLPVVQVGGGLIVISTGWALLKQGGDDAQKKVKRNIQQKDPFHNAFYPLTLPLTVGPGSISVAITLGANAPHHQGLNLLSILTAIAGSVLLAVSIFLCYGFADRLGRMLGATGMTVIIQLTSFLLVCIGVQILWNGASALLTSLSLHMR